MLGCVRKSNEQFIQQLIVSSVRWSAFSPAAILPKRPPDDPGERWQLLLHNTKAPPLESGTLWFGIKYRIIIPKSKAPRRLTTWALRFLAGRA